MPGSPTRSRACPIIRRNGFTSSCPGIGKPRPTPPRPDLGHDHAARIPPYLRPSPDGYVEEALDQIALAMEGCTERRTLGRRGIGLTLAQAPRSADWRTALETYAEVGEQDITGGKRAEHVGGGASVARLASVSLRAHRLAARIDKGVNWNAGSPRRKKQPPEKCRSPPPVVHPRHPARLVGQKLSITHHSDIRQIKRAIYASRSGGLHQRSP